MKTRARVCGGCASKVVFRVGGKLDVFPKKKKRPALSPNMRASLRRRRAAKKKTHRDILWRDLSYAVSEYQRLRRAFPGQAAKACLEATRMIADLIASGIAVAEDPRIVEARKAFADEPIMVRPPGVAGDEIQQKAPRHV